MIIEDKKVDKDFGLELQIKCYFTEDFRAEAANDGL